MAFMAYFSYKYELYDHGGNHMSLPKGKHIFGTVKVGERGQIVIPKEARELFGIKPGDTLLVLGDEEKGIAVVKADVLQDVALKILKGFGGIKSDDRQDCEDI